MLKIEDKKRVKIKDLKIKVAQKMYDMYRNDPHLKFYEKEFKQLLNDELKVESNDIEILMKYMLEKDFIVSHQDRVETSRYSSITANLIDFVENLPNA
ncbi:MAG: hypothetical protein ACFFHD_15115 [Promethearchaeota archaeon]